MALSMYHSASGKQAPHCINVVGLGKAGAQLIDALLRTGEIEDMLDDPRARFTALAIDIGEGDMRQMRQYADSFYARLDDRGIPRDRAQIRTVALDIPDAADLEQSMARFPEFLGREFPRFSWKGQGESGFASWLDATTTPTTEKNYVGQLEVPSSDEHVSRSLAKAIYGRAYYDGERPLHSELEAFADSIDQTGLPCLVLVAFGVGGGTGSGMVVDLARHLSTGALGRRVPVIGVGFMPCSGDPESSRASLIPARESSRAASMVRSLRSTDSLSQRSSASSARSTKSASGVKVNAAAVMVSSVSCWMVRKCWVWLMVSCLMWLETSGRPALRDALAAD
ncbi:hypothetical protein ABT116_42925 [Streptomyces sp. NPDC002130]|uniref:hypothetical protein n=1 Tax=Streptomyces sp. NPDC002130 TaxID=3155568 RepID=UPI00331AA5C3